MRNKANPRLVGIFVLGAFALLIGAILTFGRLSIGARPPPVVAYFEGSISGLSVGAPVNFRGVRVGSVSNIALQVDSRDLTARIPAQIAFLPNTLSWIGEPLMHHRADPGRPAGQDPGAGRAARARSHALPPRRPAAQPRRRGQGGRAGAGGRGRGTDEGQPAHRRAHGRPDKPVVFNFHSYPWQIHRLTYRRPGQHNIHVRGYKEKGNINTPLELAICNQTDRFSLAIDAIDRMPRFRVTGSGVREALLNQRISCKNHAYAFGIDSPDITNWQWPF